MSEKKKHKGLPFFNYNKDGKGVKKEEANLPFTFLNFFKYFPRHFSKMLSVNIAFVLGNFPILFILPVLAGYFHNTDLGPMDIKFPVIAGTIPFMEASGKLGIMAPLLSTVGAFGVITAETVLDHIFIGLSFLVLLTFGPINAGTSYIVRNLLKGEPVFMWDDMKYAIKRNIKQSLVYGIIDLFLTGMLIYDVYFFFANINAGFINSMFFYVSLVSLVFYIFMRYYIYLMMVTFDLKLRKLFKNAMLFAFLGFKRNILAFIAILLVCALNIIIFTFQPLMALGIALPFVITMGVCTYIAAYAAWPKIKEIMIDPYYTEEEKQDEPEKPVIMRAVL